MSKGRTDIEVLEKEISYTFKNKKLCFNALCHSSYANEFASIESGDNERLEFLGDSVVNLVIGDLLMKKFPHLNEGNLSRIRSNLVNEATLSSLSKKISLGSYLMLGKGEEMTDGRNKDSILADAFEALIASIYRDSGFDSAYKTVQFLFKDLLKNAKKPEDYLDPKSKLQEFSQMKYKEAPIYKVVKEYGPDHDKTFEVEMSVPGTTAIGKGKSKKSAEQNAAKKGLDILMDMEDEK